MLSLTQTWVVLQHTTIVKQVMMQRLAQKVQTQIASTPGFNGDRGIQEGNLYVLRHSNMPAISRRAWLYLQP